MNLPRWSTDSSVFDYRAFLSDRVTMTDDHVHIAHERNEK
jgi:hypothetical protein